jgi:hypothetical protein
MLRLGSIYLRRLSAKTEERNQLLRLFAAPYRLRLQPTHNKSHRIEKKCCRQVNNYFCIVKHCFQIDVIVDVSGAKLMFL